MTKIQISTIDEATSNRSKITLKTRLTSFNFVNYLVGLSSQVWQTVSDVLTAQDRYDFEMPLEERSYSDLNEADYSPHKPLNNQPENKQNTSEVDNQLKQLEPQIASTPTDDVTMPSVPYLEEGQSCAQCQGGKMEVGYELDEETEQRYACLWCSQCQAKGRLFTMNRGIGQTCPQCQQGKMELGYAVDKTGEPYACLLCSYRECNAKAYTDGSRYMHDGEPCYYCGEGIMTLLQNDALEAGIYQGKPYLECHHCLAYAALATDKRPLVYMNIDDCCTQCQQGDMHITVRINKQTGEIYQYLVCSFGCGAKAYPHNAAELAVQGGKCPKCARGILQRTLSTADHCWEYYVECLNYKVCNFSTYLYHNIYVIH